MTYQRTTKRPAAVTGTSEKLLRTLRSARHFTGPVTRLAEVASCNVLATWRALEYLDYRKLISARSAGEGIVSVHVTPLGRRFDLTPRQHR